MNPDVFDDTRSAPRRRNDVPDDSLEEARWAEQAQRLHYQELIEFAPDGYLVTDRYGVIREANYTAATLLNTRKEFLLGKPLPAFVAAKERREFYGWLARLGRLGETVHDWHARLCPINREPIDVNLIVAADSGASGGPTGFRWLFRDATAMRKTEQAFQTEKTFSDALVRTALIAIVVVDAEGKLLRANPYLSALSGYSSDELLGRDWTDILIAEEDRPASREMMKALIFGVPTEAVLGLVVQDGSRRAIAWTGKSLTPIESAEEMAILLTGQDVTALQEAQRKTVQAERLAAIGQMTAGLAHESRNALQRSQSYLSILSLKLRDRPEELEYLARLQRAQDDLHRLYEEVREYAAPIQLETSVCRLADIWREAWEELGPVREGKGAELWEETGGIEWECPADVFRLKQVFRNLLENALAAGGAPPRVEIRCTPTRIEGRDAVEVAIRDNGPGFKPEQRKKIFEPFFTTKVRGTGLGLAICKRVIEAHGGRIEAGAGGGAEIIISLPQRTT